MTWLPSINKAFTYLLTSEFPEFVIRLQIGTGTCAVLTGDAIVFGEFNKLVRLD